MKLYIVRHGSDDESYRGGWSNIGLIERGREESRLLARYMQENNFSIDRIISSDLKRAVETADEIRKIFQVPIVYDTEWREMNNGKLAGLLNSEALNLYPNLFFNTLRMDEHYPGGESPLEFYQRIKTSLEMLCREMENDSSNVLLITHSGVILIIYYLLNNIEWTNQSKPLCEISKTGIHTIEFKDGKWNVIESNNINHLKDLKRH